MTADEKDSGREEITMHAKKDEKNRLLEELAVFMASLTEESFDEKRLDEILDELDKIDPLPPLKSTEESLREFWAAHGDLLDTIERRRAPV